METRRAFKIDGPVFVVNGLAPSAYSRSIFWVLPKEKVKVGGAIFKGRIYIFPEPEASGLSQAMK